MLRVANKLFITTGATGEFYVVDDEGFKRYYKVPYQEENGLGRKRGTFFGNCYWHAQDKVVFAGEVWDGTSERPTVVYVDPVSLDVETEVLGASEGIEFLGAVEFDDKLYITERTGGFYEFTGLHDYSQLSDLSDEIGIDDPHPRPVIRFNDNFVVGFAHNGTSVWRSPDGSSWSQVLDADSPVRVLTTDNGRLLVGAENKVYSVDKDWNVETGYLHPRSSVSRQGSRIGEGPAYPAQFNNIGAVVAFPRREKENEWNPNILYMNPYSAAMDIGQYRGHLWVMSGYGIVSEYATRFKDTRDSHVGFVDVLSLHEKPVLYPLPFDPWVDQSISAGDTTDPLPTFQYGSGAVYFKTDTAGTLTIQVDLTGTGDWMDYDTVSLDAGEATHYPFSRLDFARYRLKFSDAATVTARAILKE